MFNLLWLSEDLFVEIFLCSPKFMKNGNLSRQFGLHIVYMSLNNQARVARLFHLCLSKALIIEQFAVITSEVGYLLILMSA